MSDTLSSGLTPDYLATLTGPLPVTLTNDVMFHMVFQTANDVLKGLIAALLEIRVDEIHSIEILNPIIPGSTVDEKQIVLDLYVVLNSRKILDIEMQMSNRGDWIERSLFYACRNVAELSLARGDDYSKMKPVLHIGILDYPPPVYAARHGLYTKYLLREEKTNDLYSDKFALHVLNLTYLDKVPETERNTALYKWARLFLVKTWEELKAAAKEVYGMSEFVVTMAKLSEDDQVRMACRAREDYERTMKGMYESGKAEAEAEMSALLADRDARLAADEKRLADRDREIRELKAKLAAFEKK